MGDNGPLEQRAQKASTFQEELEGLPYRSKGFWLSSATRLCCNSRQYLRCRVCPCRRRSSESFGPSHLPLLQRYLQDTKPRSFLENRSNAGKHEGGAH